MLTRKASLLTSAVLIGLAFGGDAHASLTLFQSYFGNVGKSTDGCGSLNPTCTLISDVPVGSTILGAYLYSSTFATTTNPNGTTLQTGAALPFAPTFTALGINGQLQAWRADVTQYITNN